MRKLILLLCSAVLAGLILSGCYKDIIHPGADPNGPPQSVSFSGDLIPIFNKSCNSSGCHDGVPTKNPSLSPDKAYNALMSGGYINTLVPGNSSIYLSVKDNSMPIGGSLTAAEKQKILDWIRNGAPNN
jgi:hypothetical protein